MSNTDPFSSRPTRVTRTPNHDGRNQPPPRRSPHFFTREPDGGVRFRLKLAPDLAALVEEAAGDTHLMVYIQRVLRERAKYHIKKRAEVEGELPRDIPDSEDVVGL